MMTRGKITNEYGDTVGRYWWRSGQNRFSFIWHGIRRNGYTEEGLIDWANRLEYNLEEE